MPVKVKFNKLQFIGLLLVLSAAFSVVRFDAIPVGALFDDAHYIVLAESLAAGTGYHLINYPTVVAEAAFPPGWPLLLTPFVALFSGNLALLKLLPLAFWLGTIPLIYRLLANKLKSPYLEATLALIALNPYLVGMATAVMSEAAFLFFSVLTLNLLAMWQEATGRKRGWLLAAVAVTAVFTLLIRTIGVTMVATVLVYVLLNGRRRNKWIAIGLFFLALVPLALFNMQNGGAFVFSSLYNEHVRYVVGQVVNFLQFWQHAGAFSPVIMADAFFPVVGAEIAETLLTSLGVRWLSLLFLALIFWGVVLSWRQCDAQEIYVILYMGIFYVWTAYIGYVQVRILLPMIPFLYRYLVASFIWMARRVTLVKQRQRTIIGGAVALVMVSIFVRNVANWRAPLSTRIMDLSVGAQWIQENASVDAIIMSSNPVPDYLYVRRQTVDYPPAGADINQIIGEQEVAFVMIRPLLQEWDNNNQQLDPVTQTELLPYLTENPDQFQPVYRNVSHNVWVFQVIDVN